jgi:Holliday junction resolvase-like predicted endonuclease
MIEYASMVYIVWASAKYGYTAYRQMSTVNRGKSRRLKRDAKTFKLPSVSPEKTKKILEAANVSVLRDMQIKREVTSVDIVSVYSQRCFNIGRKLNLVSEEYYTEALEMAA